MIPRRSSRGMLLLRPKPFGRWFATSMQHSTALQASCDTHKMALAWPCPACRSGASPPSSSSLVARNPPRRPLSSKLIIAVGGRAAHTVHQQQQLQTQTLCRSMHKVRGLWGRTQVADHSNLLAHDLRHVPWMPAASMVSAPVTPWLPTSRGS